VFKILPVFINEGIKICFFVCKAIFHLFPFQAYFSKMLFTKESEFIMEMVNFFDTYFKNDSEEFITVG
jgi:hypothetical protein